MRLCMRMPSTASGTANVHVVNMASLGIFAVLLVSRSGRSANFGSLFHFGRNGTSVTLQNRSAVSANFGLHCN